MDTTRCDHQRKQAELSRREQPHPTSRSRRTTATRHRGLFGSSLAMGVLSICTTENDPVKYNLNVCHVWMEFLYHSIEQILHSKSLCLRSASDESSIYIRERKKTEFILFIEVITSILYAEKSFVFIDWKKKRYFEKISGKRIKFCKVFHNPILLRNYLHCHDILHK